MIKRFNILTLFSVCLWIFPGRLYAQSNPGDTIIIDFGDNSRILFLIDSREDLETLMDYDLNAMLRDLKVSLEESEGEPTRLTIQDESGTRYLKDTTIVIESRAQDEPTIIVETNDNDFEEPRPSRRYWNRTRRSFNIELGINNYLEDGEFPDNTNAPYSVKPFGSWYVGLNATYRTRVFGILFAEWGGGIDWYNFKFDNAKVRIFKTDSATIFFEDPRQDLNAIKSKLTATYLYAKFIPMLDFSNSRRSRLWNYHGDGFRIGAGIYAAYRIASHSKFVYKDGDREKDKDKENFFLENFRYGLRGQLGYRGVDFFIMYDMNELFSEGRGPALNALTFGFTF